MALYGNKTGAGCPMTGESDEFIDLKPELANFRDDVIRGLSGNPKMIPPKFFYDETGSELFNSITATDEYYVTNAEEEILLDNGRAIAESIGSGTLMIEYGSGNSRKTSILISSLIDPAAYVLIDISPDAVQMSARKLSGKFPQLKVVSVCADYLMMDEIPLVAEGGKKVIVFLGSTIGNFEPEDARNFLNECHGELSSGDGMLIGVDLKKDVNVLNRAYNDSEGFTEKFNLNLLWRIKRELDSDIDPGTFAHRAFYNVEKGRIEMHLVSRVDQTIRIGGNIFHFDKGESIHTESSYKYTVDQFKELAAVSKLEVDRVWMDKRNYFGLFYLKRIED